MSENKNNILVPAAIIIAGLVIAGAIMLNGAFFSGSNNASSEDEPEVAGAEQPAGAEADVEVDLEAIEGLGREPLIAGLDRFEKPDNEVCTNEEGLPIIYYFGSSSCPHCTWEHPVIKGTMAYFADYVDFKDWMDVRDEETIAVFEQYSDYNNGAVPFLVFGCRYARLGSGEQLGVQGEAAVLSAVTCKLTDGQPGDVCGRVEDLTAEIE